MRTQVILGLALLAISIAVPVYAANDTFEIEVVNKTGVKLVNFTAR